MIRRDVFGSILCVAALVAFTGCRPSDRAALAWGARAAEAQDERAAAADPTARRLWAGEFVRFRETSVSPDGRYVTWTQPPRPGIAVRDMQTDALHSIIEPPVDPDAFHDFWNPVFSRDGRRIAFTWYTFRDGRQEIGVGVAEFETDGADAPRGSAPRLAYTNPVREPYPFDWSPDGRWILGAVYSPDATVALALLPAAGDTARVLESLGWRPLGHALFSPDGRFVAYDVPPEDDARARHIHVVSVDGSQKRLVVGGAARNRLFAWAPDGSILYVTDEGGAPSLRRQAMAGGAPAGRPELVRNDFWRAMPIGFAGTTFHYGVVVDRPTLHIVDLDLGAGRLVGGPRPVEDPLDGRARAFAWSPDGSHLAVAHRDPGDRAARLTIRTAEGAVVGDQALRFSPGRLHWSHDGASLMAFGRDDRGRRGFHRIRLGTGAHDLVLRVETMGRFALSRHDQTLFYVRRESSDVRQTVVRHTLATGDERSIGPASNLNPPVALSPDETEIATVTWAEDPDTAQVAIAIPATGGAYREVFRVAWPAVIGSLDWTPDGAALLVVVSRRFTNPVDSELWLVPAHGTGAARKVDGLGGFDGGRVSLHPSGRRLAYVTGANRGEIWALDLGGSTTASAARTSP
jgi:Tol biopolymer transport system component